MSNINKLKISYKDHKYTVNSFNENFVYLEAPNIEYNDDSVYSLTSNCNLLKVDKNNFNSYALYNDKLLNYNILQKCKVAIDDCYLFDLDKLDYYLYKCVLAVVYKNHILKVCTVSNNHVVLTSEHKISSDFEYDSDHNLYYINITSEEFNDGATLECYPITVNDLDKFYVSIDSDWFELYRVNELRDYLKEKHGEQNMEEIKKQDDISVISVMFKGWEFTVNNITSTDIYLELGKCVTKNDVKPLGYEYLYLFESNGCIIVPHEDFDKCATKNDCPITVAILKEFFDSEVHGEYLFKYKALDDYIEDRKQYEKLQKTICYTNLRTKILNSKEFNNDEKIALLKLIL